MRFSRPAASAGRSSPSRSTRSTAAWAKRVAAVLMQAGVAVPLRIVGIPDEDTVTGSQADIFRHYGLTMEGLAATAIDLLKQAEVSA